jgi:hypothetical protein
LFLLFLTTILLPASYASTEKEYVTLISKIESKIKQCNTHVEQVLKKGYVYDKQDELSFIQNEKEAITIIKSIDLGKVSFEENILLQKFVFDSCSSNLKVKLKECDYFPHLYTFHRALALSLRHSAWSKNTKQEGLAKLREYLEHMSKARTHLTDKSMGIDMLKFLADEGFVDTNNYQKVKELSIEAYTTSSIFQKRRIQNLKEFDKNKKTCADSASLQVDELAEAKRLGETFQQVLKNIKLKSP